MLPMVLKELEKAHFKAMMSWTTAVEEGVAVTVVICKLAHLPMTVLVQIQPLHG